MRYLLAIVTMGAVISEAAIIPLERKDYSFDRAVFHTTEIMEISNFRGVKVKEERCINLYLIEKENKYVLVDTRLVVDFPEVTPERERVTFTIYRNNGSRKYNYRVRQLWYVTEREINDQR